VFISHGALYFSGVNPVLPRNGDDNQRAQFQEYDDPAVNVSSHRFPCDILAKVSHLNSLSFPA